jgi:hypothetical protein
MSTNCSRIGFVTTQSAAQPSEEFQLAQQLDAARQAHTDEVRGRFEERIRYINIVWSLGTALALAVALLLYTYGPIVIAHRYTIARSVTAIAAYPLHFFASGYTEFCRTATYDQRRLYECPTPSYAPLPAPVVQTPAQTEIAPFHTIPMTPDAGIRDEAYEVEDKWLGAMTKDDRLEGSMLTFASQHVFERSYFGSQQSIFVRNMDNVVLFTGTIDGNSEPYHTRLIEGYDYVITKVVYNDDRSVAEIELDLP